MYKMERIEDLKRKAMTRCGERIARANNTVQISKVETFGVSGLLRMKHGLM